MFILLPIANNQTPPFSFTNLTNLSKNTQYASNVIIPEGVLPGLSVTISSGQVNVNGAGWASSGIIYTGQTLQVRSTTNDAWSSAKQVTITIGSSQSVWTITTAAIVAGSWDTGWTYGSWTFTTPVAWSSLIVRLWASGGGGGGGAGIVDDTETWGAPTGSYGESGAGGAGGGASFGGIFWAFGGGGGLAGATRMTSAGYQGPTTAGSGTPGSYGGAYTAGVVGGGAAGAAAGDNYGWASQPVYYGINGGNGGAGGYVYRTFAWGQLSPNTGYGVSLGYPGAPGTAWTAVSWHCGQPFGRVPLNGYSYGGFGRAYITWS